MKNELRVKVGISIIIPAYNEEENLKKGVLEQVQNFMDQKKIDYEVIIVDDGSQDKTKEIIRKLISKNSHFKLIENSHGGKAIAVMTGLLDAKNDLVLFTDMDQATPINQLDKFLPKFEEGYEIVIGSRSGRKGAPLIRKISAIGFSILRRIILGLPFSDTQCGFKAFNKKAINKIIPRIKDEWGVVHTGKSGAVNAGFDVELLYLAKKYGFRIAEVPVVWNYVDTERVQVIKDALAAVYDMIRIRLNDITGKYAYHV